MRGLDSLKKAADLPQYKENEQKIRREIAILKKCAHPHVVKLREVIDDPASRKIYMGKIHTPTPLCGRSGEGEKRRGKKVGEYKISNFLFSLALEYMEGGEIEWRNEDEMPVLSVDEARSVFRDVVSGLDYRMYLSLLGVK